MYSSPKFLGLNTTITFVVFYATSKAIGALCIINVHCFWAVVEIPCSEKSAKSETSNYELRFFYVFFETPLPKKRKKSRFLDF